MTFSLKTMAVPTCLTHKRDRKEIPQGDYIDIDIKCNTCTKKVLELQA